MQCVRVCAVCVNRRADKVQKHEVEESVREAGRKGEGGGGAGSGKVGVGE